MNNRHLHYHFRNDADFAAAEAKLRLQDEELAKRFHAFNWHLEQAIRKLTDAPTISAHDAPSAKVFSNYQLSIWKQNMIALSEVIPHFIELIDRSQAEDHDCDPSKHH